MIKKYFATKEEFKAIQEAITNVLQLWHYPFIEANNGDGSATMMSKETFFEALAEELNVKEIS